MAGVNFRHCHFNPLKRIGAYPISDAQSSGWWETSSSPAGPTRIVTLQSLADTLAKGVSQPVSHMPPEVTYPTNKPEPTLGELRTGGVNVYVRCSACLHPKWLTPAELRGDDQRTLSELAKRLRCGRCGEGQRIEVSLIPEQWVRYLRATGQTDRLPEDTDLYFPAGQPYGWP